MAMAVAESRETVFTHQRHAPAIVTVAWRRDTSPSSPNSTSHGATSPSDSFSSSSSSSQRKTNVNTGSVQPALSSSRPHYVNTVIPPPHIRKNYENVCQDTQPLIAFPARKTSRESSITDSEISLSSAASIEAFSANYERRKPVTATSTGKEKSDTLEHYSQLKMKPGSKMSEKTRKILYRPNRAESDSSSSLAESTDSLSAVEMKQKEIEHYNKLKLSFDRISGNKRALIGLKILYRDPPRGFRNQTSSTNSYSVLQRKRLQSIFHDENVSSTRFWSERHSNKLHSVTPNPVRSKSLWWHQDDTSSTTLPGPAQVALAHPTAFRSRSLSDTQSSKITMQEVALKTRKVSSRSMDNFFSILRKSNGAPSSANDEVDSLDTPFIQPRQRLYTDPGISTRGKVAKKHGVSETGLNRKRGSSASKNLLDEDCTSGSIYFIESPTILVYNGDDLEYHSKEHNFTVKIPKRAVKKRGTTEIQVGLAMHGPFSFPERTRNISPILWLCTIPDTKLRKPVQVTLSHCITTAHYNASTKQKKADKPLRLQFASASLKSGYSSKARKRQFEFHPTEGEEVIWSEEMRGSILVRHLSPICIVASSGRTTNLTREISFRSWYCVVPVVPKTISGTEWSIHFCITFHLPSCIQSLKSYYKSQDFHLLPPHPFLFSPFSSVEERWSEREKEEEEEEEEEGEGERGDEEPELEIRFPRQLPESGWSLLLQSERKIAASSISFSPCRRADLLLLSSSYSSYASSSPPHSSPPGFTLLVCGERAERDAVTCISFVGSIEPVTVKVSLPLSSTACQRDKATNASSPPPPVCPPHSFDEDYDHLDITL